MNAVSANEAQAAATRYGMQQQDLNRAADISMAEWQGLMSENLAGNQIGAQQNLARNAQNLAGTQLGLQQSLAGNAANQQNVDRALQQSLAGNQFNQSNYQTAVNAGLTGQQLGAAQNLAMNAQNLTGTQLGLQQSLAGNQFNQANWQTGVNAGLTGQQLGAAQNLAMNAANQQNMDRGLLQATNANNLSQAQWMARINEQQGLAQIGANQNLAQNAQGVSMAQLAQQGLLANAQNRLTADTTQNEFGLNLFDKGLQRENNINQFNLANTAGLRTEADTAARYGALNTDAQNQYNTLRYNNDKTYNDQLTNWANQQNYERNFLYPQQQAAYSQSQDEMLMNRALALAGQGAPLANSANNYALQQQQMAAQQAAANQQSQAQLWGAGMGLLGNLGNSYLNNYTGNGLLGLSQK